MTLLLALMLYKPANASFFERLCQRIILEDPYHFEDYSTSALKRMELELLIRESWNTLTKNDLAKLQRIRSTLRMREYARDLVECDVEVLHTSLEASE
jgi:hypothetical protein